MRLALVSFLVWNILTACGERKTFSGQAASGAAQAQKQTQDAPADIHNETVQQNAEALPPSQSIAEQSQDFTISLQSSGKVDMVWLIDNSSSMEQEAGQVRSNLEKFMSSIASRADVRVTLISDDDGKFGVKLSSAAIAAGHQQISIPVASKNALSLLASSLCSPESTNFPTSPADVSALPKSSGDILANSPYKLCGLSVESRRFLMREMQVSLIKGLLLKRMRPDAAKVFVFVSDDDIEGPINAENLLSTIKMSPMLARTFAFAGKDTSNCEIARMGVTYKNLAASTKGEVFDICEADWSANFSKLSASVISIANNRFSIIGQNKIIIKNVALDGMNLSPNDFVVEGSTVIVTNEALLLKGKVLRVSYEPSL